MKRTTVIISLIPVYLLVFFALICCAVIADRSVTTLVENNQISNRNCVIIDPGHGGVDGGATSCTGVLESEINLQISLKLNDLMHLIGIDTVLIRDSDCSVYTQGNTIAQKKISDLKERVRIVNNTENALLISVHQNHFSDGRYYGPQVFYGKIGESSTLARKMQSALINSLCSECNRKAKPSSGVYLLNEIKCEGILIECGFLSNYEEEVKLRSSDYQMKLCCVIAATCANYLNNREVT